MFKKVFDFFIFSSLYIAGCAVLMVYQAATLFLSHQLPVALYFFVFFATVCSYNFHWFLTNESVTVSERLNWALRFKWLHFVLYIIGLIGSIFFFFQLREHWLWIGIGAFVTFLYSAPKIPQHFFAVLKRIAVGKTLFLAFVWMYVTTILPFFVSRQPWQFSFILFACSRFFLIYAICVLFDYRDREDDKKAGIRSMITYLNERGIDNLFAGSLLLFAVATAALLWYGYSYLQVTLLFIPAIITAALYKYAKKHFSDYFYYFILDGLMMLSALLMLFIH